MREKFPLADPSGKQRMRLEVRARVHLVAHQFSGIVGVLFKRADLSVHSTPTAGTSWSAWFARNWVNVLYRLATCTVFFMLWLASASGSTVLGTLIANLPGATLIAKYLPVPQLNLESMAAALVFGLAADWFVDYFIAKVWPSTQKKSQRANCQVRFYCP